MKIKAAIYRSFFMPVSEIFEDRSEVVYAKKASISIFRHGARSLPDDGVLDVPQGECRF
ncbi:MAG: hypothetical protein IPN95_30140 [Bacteroidetes bacterium]|nr:hypothetical protein [Bacteroidota bacterium]